MNAGGLWSFRFHPDAQRELRKLDPSVVRLIGKRLHWLTANASAVQHLPLRFDLGGLYKLRAGDWRLIYRLVEDKRVVLVVGLGHRSEVYEP